MFHIRGNWIGESKDSMIAFFPQPPSQGFQCINNKPADSCMCRDADSRKDNSKSKMWMKDQKSGKNLVQTEEGPKTGNFFHCI